MALLGEQADIHRIAQIFHAGLTPLAGVLQRVGEGAHQDLALNAALHDPRHRLTHPRVRHFPGNPQRLRQIVGPDEHNIHPRHREDLLDILHRLTPLQLQDQHRRVRFGEVGDAVGGGVLGRPYETAHPAHPPRGEAGSLEDPLHVPPALHLGHLDAPCPRVKDLSDKRRSFLLDAYNRQEPRHLGGPDEVLQGKHVVRAMIEVQHDEVKARVTDHLDEGGV